MISPSEKGINIDLESVVLLQYGDEIKNTIKEVLKAENVNNVNIIAKDKGALDFTIRARVKTCIKRARSEQNEL